MFNYSKGKSTPNRPILEKCKTLKSLVSSSDESDKNGTFKNAQKMIPFQHIIETVYLHQKDTKGDPIVTYNITTQGILTHFIIPHKKNLGYEITLVIRPYFSKKYN